MELVSRVSVEEAQEMLELCRTIPKLKNRMLKRLAGPTAPRDKYVTKGGYKAEFLKTPVASMRVTGRNKKEQRLLEIVKAQGITFSAMQLNGPNLVAAKHKDKNNCALSTIMYLGEYKGGSLNIEGEDGVYRWNTTGEWFTFDGKNQWHWSDEVTEGEKYAIVLY